MQVQEIMTRNPACCSPAATLQDIAQLMQQCDCGEIPVLDSMRRPIGVVTDRDICIRGVAKALDVTRATAQDIMTTPVHTVQAADSVEACCQLMEEQQIRRVPVVDEQGICCGIVAQADIARELGGSDTAEVVRDISQPRAGAQPH